MDENKSFGKVFLQQTVIVFTLAIACVALIGWLSPYLGIRLLGDAPEMSLHGLSFQVLMQLLLFAVICGLIAALLTTDVIIKNMLHLWRSVLFHFLSIVACGLFVVIFGWFPLGDLRAWIGLLLIMTGAFVLGSAPMIIKVKLDDRRYEKLLSDYKSKREGERND